MRQAETHTGIDREVVVFDRYLDTQQVAEILNISVQAARRWCETGKLRASRFGALWRVKVVDLQEFISEGEREGHTYSKNYNTGVKPRTQRT